jgi:hypothetical protein
MFLWFRQFVQRLQGRVEIVGANTAAVAGLQKHDHIAALPGFLRELEQGADQKGRIDLLVMHGGLSFQVMSFLHRAMQFFSSDRTFHPQILLVLVRKSLPFETAPRFQGHG